MNSIVLHEQSDFIDDQDINYFMLFTSAGAVGATGTNSLVNTRGPSFVGSNDTAPVGFDPAVYSLQTANAITASATNYLPILIAALRAMPPTNTTHAPGFIDAEIVPPGVYTITGASSAAGTVTFDGQGNANSLFIVKIGGALALAAATKFVLINKAIVQNLFFVATGAITVGAGSEARGIFITDAGAIAIGATCLLDGRMLTSLGAITIGAGAILSSVQ